MTTCKPVVGVSEAVTLLFIFITAKVFLTYIAFVLNEGGNASYLIPVLNTLAGLLVVLLLAAVLDRYPGQDLVQIGELLTGPYINTVFSLYYLALFIVGAGLSLRSVSERMVAGFLPDTPISMVTMFLLISALVVAYLGLEAVARTARFLVAVMVVSALAMVALTIPYWQGHVFFPLLGEGPWAIVRGALKNNGSFWEIVLLGMLVPFLPRGAVRRVGVWAVLVAGFFITLLVLVSLLIFTYPSARELALPTFEMARIINIGRFGQRMEVIFLPVWVFGNLIFISTALYAAASVLARLCRLQDQRPFTLSAAVFTVVVAFSAQNAVQVSYWSQHYLIGYGYYLLLLILSGLWLAGRLKKTEKGERDEGPQEQRA